MFQNESGKQNLDFEKDSLSNIYVGSILPSLYLA